MIRSGRMGMSKHAIPVIDPSSRMKPREFEIVRCGSSNVGGSPSCKRRRLDDHLPSFYKGRSDGSAVDKQQQDDGEDCCNRFAVTPSPEPPYKRVRFASHVSYSKDAPHPFPCDAMERRKLWYSRDERAEIIDENRTLVHDFELDHEDQVKHYQRVFERCLEPPSEATSDYLEKVTVSIPTRVRGLEWGTCFAMKDYRREHAQEVLKVQRQLPKSMDPQMQSRILSSRAMRSSRPSRVMARLIGEGDSRS